MRQFIVVVALLAAVVGCRRGYRSDFGDAYEPVEEVAYDYDPTLMVDPAFYENVKTSELGTDVLRGPAKSVDWAFGSVEEGTTYIGGAIGVEKIHRNDAENFYNVSIRLRNRQATAQKIEWKIALFDGTGARVSGLTDWVGEKEVWHAASLEPHAFVSVSNGARLKGATVFRLHVRRAGASDEGHPEGSGGTDAIKESADALKKMLDE